LWDRCFLHRPGFAFSDLFLFSVLGWQKRVRRRGNFMGIGAAHDGLLDRAGFFGFFSQGPLGDSHEKNKPLQAIKR